MRPFLFIVADSRFRDRERFRTRLQYDPTLRSASKILLQRCCRPTPLLEDRALPHFARKSDIPCPQ